MNAPDATLTNGTFVLPEAANGVGPALVLATPPEMGWTRTDAQATADTELLARPWPEPECDCEQPCDACVLEQVRDG